MKTYFNNRITLGLLLISATASALYTPLATDFTLINIQGLKLDIETDMNIGAQVQHRGKPSDFNDMADELVTSINVKEWLKINLDYYNTFAASLILEFTLFEVQPLDFHYWMTQLPNWWKLLIGAYDWNEFDGHFSMSYYLDLLSVKLFYIEYPIFCTVDAAAAISFAANQGTAFAGCGYRGGQKRIEPLHAQDPNLYYSLLRFFAPSFFGMHNYVKLDVSSIKALIIKGLGLVGLVHSKN